MALHVPGLLTRSMAAIVTPRNTSSERRRVVFAVCWDKRDGAEGAINEGEAASDMHKRYGLARDSA